MLDGLRTSMLATRRFTADAGHELRTPLASLGIDLESLRHNPNLPAEQRSAMLAAMTREHTRIVDLLEGLQALARGDAGALPAFAQVDIGELIESCVARARGRHSDVDYHVLTGAQPLPAVSGWRDGLQVAIGNLLDNAAVHGAHVVEIAVFTAAPDTVTISVGDDGPGIPAASRAEVRRRFVRGPATEAGGSGLGLALVDQQVSLHGGTFGLGESASGGLRATIVLPRS
jgi:signal transduction histidine kinase